MTNSDFLVSGSFCKSGDSVLYTVVISYNGIKIQGESRQSMYEAYLDCRSKLSLSHKPKAWDVLTDSMVSEYLNIDQSKHNANVQGNIPVVNATHRVIDDLYTVTKTVEQAVELLMIDLLDPDKRAIRNLKEEDLIFLHHSLGRDIRNDFRLWHREDLNDDALKYKYSGNKHPDNTSMVIIHTLWSVLNGRSEGLTI